MGIRAYTYRALTIEYFDNRYILKVHLYKTKIQSVAVIKQLLTKYIQKGATHIDLNLMLGLLPKLL